MRELAILVGILVSSSVVTQQRPPQFEMEIKTIKLTDSLYILEGAGGNVAAFIWDEGVLLVDDKLAPASADVKAAVAAITPKPIRFVVNSHYSNGGVFTGIIAAADTALGMLDNRTRIIPGHGPVASDQDLRMWREMLATIYERVKKSVAVGRSLEQVKAERPTKEWDERFPRSFVTPDHVVEEAYRAVTSRK